MRIIKIFIVLFITLSASVALTQPLFPKEIVLYDFEKDPQGWAIPDWALSKKDHVAESIGVTEFQAATGHYALEIGVNFPGGSEWRAAYVERAVDINDWSPFSTLSASIFIPKDASRGLRVRFVLTVGDGWKWTEMNKAINLVPGEWVTLKCDLTEKSMDWRRFITDDFRSDVKKVGVRVEATGNSTYKGPVFVDNIKLND